MKISRIIFLCHAKEDIKAVKNLHDSLKQAGFKPSRLYYRVIIPALERERFDKSPFEGFENWLDQSGIEIIQSCAGVTGLKA